MAFCGAVVSTVTCVLPLPGPTEAELKAQLLRLPAGTIEQDAGVKATVPLYPSSAVIVSVAGGEVAPGDDTVTLGLPETNVKSITSNVSALEAPPPGVGLKTVTGSVAELARSAIGIGAVNCVELM
jgi:hypothetical protein